MRACEEIETSLQGGKKNGVSVQIRRLGDMTVEAKNQYDWRDKEEEVGQGRRETSDNVL